MVNVTGWPGTPPTIAGSIEMARTPEGGTKWPTSTIALFEGFGSELSLVTFTFTGTLPLAGAPINTPTVKLAVAPTESDAVRQVTAPCGMLIWQPIEGDSSD